MEVQDLGNFHQYSTCGCQVINFQMFSWWCSIHEMAPFWGFMSFFSPKYNSILMTFWPEVASHETKTVLEQSFKVLCLSRKGTYSKFTVLLHVLAQCCWKNFCCSSIKTCVIPVLVSIFVLFLSPFFTFGQFFAESFEKKNI